MKVLVAGAAGYIGSHAVRALLRAGHDVVALDNLSRGHRVAVPSHVPFHEADVRQSGRMLEILRSHQVECVVHFAAFAYVGESVVEPLLYYDNNTLGTLGLLRAVAQSDCRKFVFSSTCATYGVPETLPIHERIPQNPINPYGASKLCSERMLCDLRPALPDFSCAILRYFNVAGCATDGSLGEHHEPETHLIPVILQAALGQRERVTVFGTDHPTDDGTCIRDYLHVEDLVDAHVAVLESLKPGEERIYNLGVGRGHSVQEVLRAARAVLDRSFEVEFGPRRSGDPPSLFSDPAKILHEIGWKARLTDLAHIIETAWRWFRDHPRRYG
jgi:UDP-glucose 4-epimerase